MRIRLCFLPLLAWFAACSPGPAPAPVLTPGSTGSAVDRVQATRSPAPLAPLPPSTEVLSASSPTAAVGAPVRAPDRMVHPEVRAAPGAAYETLLQIPAGSGGIRYSGQSVPNALAILPDGTFLISDPTDNRLLRYDLDAGLVQMIDLFQLDIVNVSDLVATQNEIYLLEISFNVAPQRYRISRLTFDGVLVKQYDIPQGYWFEDGLYGLGPVGENGEIVLEFYGELFRYIQLSDLETGTFADVNGLTAFGQTYLPSFGSFVEPVEMPAILVAGQRIESSNTMGGLVKILQINPDGSFYAIREDMVSDFPVVQGDITVHFVTVEGMQAGAARYPISEWYSFVQRQVAVGPDGEVYALLPRKGTVDLLRLLFYPSIDPLVAGAAVPLVGRLAATP